MDETEIVNALRLIRTPNIGPVTYNLLLARYGDATNAVRYLPDIGKRQRRKFAIADKASCQAIMDDMASLNVHILVRGMTNYPERLNHFNDAPPVMFAKGHLSLLKKDCFAIVGARNASLNASKIAQDWSSEIGNAGYCIISGLARGIDRAAHLGALATGTIGVTACGIDVIYPQENEDLYQNCAQSGLILTEMMPGTQPNPRAFPARNRIIASLAKAVIVIEAAKQSGSLITAREVSDRGGDVLAVPGSPFDKRAAGCNLLIQQGALLVTSADDIIRHLSSPLTESVPLMPLIREVDLSQIDEAMIEISSKKILENLTIDPVDIDELMRWCHVSAQVIRVALLELEIAGHVTMLSGNRVCLRI